jgi:predicted methyltransferase
MARLRAPARFASGMAVVLLAMGTVAEASDASGEGQRIVETLRLAAGMTAADVGAGEGKFTGVLARSGGPSGRVFATEVDASKLDELKTRRLPTTWTIAGDASRSRASTIASSRSTPHRSPTTRSSSPTGTGSRP